MCRYDEVLVGAPMYSGYGTNGAIASVERGRVYIFRNTQVSGAVVSYKALYYYYLCLSIISA